MKRTVLLSLFVALNTFLNPFFSTIGTSAIHKPKSRPANFSPVASPTAMITGQSPGPTPFIAQINATLSPANSLKSVQFSVTPKAASVTRPISATYSSSYLQSRGYLNIGTGSATVPVFGLYANSSNTVVLNFLFTDGSSQQNLVTVSTVDWTDTCNQFKNPIVLQARTNATSLGYDYMMIKNDCGSQSPVIIDTDGVPRWVGPTGFTTHASMLFANGIYILSTPPSGSDPTGISRIEFDGILSFVQDYSNIGVTNAGHHNYDPGKRGLLLEVDTTAQIESVILEVDLFGNVLNTWNFADIISQAMTAGGDDPTQFVKPAPMDWFHMNAATYRESDNTLIVSSRENFVIAVDYDTRQIKWILGDPTKKWYQFLSLRQYALSLDLNSLPPIGQHAVSITHDDNLLLFDDGFFSLSNIPRGADRSYSAPRKYHIDTQAKTATEIWNYPNGQSLYSRICSSVYEDDPTDYLVDYADISNLGPTQYAELVGLDNAGNKIFDYRYNTTGCDTAWNSIPIHLEGMMFTSVVPLNAVSRKMHGSAGTYDINLPLSGTAGIECRSGGAAGDYQLVVTFAKSISITAATVTPGNGGTASVSGLPAASGNQVTINLTNVSNIQTLTVNLLGVNDGTNTDDVPVRLSILGGDTSGNGFVNSSDIALTQSQSGQVSSATNFREDVTASGLINSSDIGFVQSKSGTALP